MAEIERGVCYYHENGEVGKPVLDRPHGGGMTILKKGQKFTDWGSAWTWYVRYPGAEWSVLKKPEWMGY